MSIVIRTTKDLSQDSRSLSQDFMDESKQLCTCVQTGKIQCFYKAPFLIYIYMYVECLNIHYSTYRQPHSNISCVVPTIWVYRLVCLFVFLVVALEHVGTLHTDLSLPIDSIILHFWYIHQFNTTARYRGTHVFWYMVPLNCECYRSTAFCLAIALHNLQTGTTF